MKRNVGLDERKRRLEAATDALNQEIRQAIATGVHVQLSIGTSADSRRRDRVWPWLFVEVVR